MSLLEKILGNGKYAAFLDKPSADKAWLSMVRQKIVSKPQYSTNYDFEQIVNSLAPFKLISKKDKNSLDKNDKISQNHVNGGRIGDVEKNTRLYISANNVAQSRAQNKPEVNQGKIHLDHADLKERYSAILNDAELSGRTHRNMGKIDLDHVEHSEVYFVIPEGARLNGRIYRTRVVKTIPVFKDDKVPDIFVSMLRDYYNDAQITEIYDILTGSSFPVTEKTPQKTNWRKTALITALAAGAAAVIGLYSCHVPNESGNPTKSPIQNQYQKYTEPSKNTPLMQRI